MKRAKRNTPAITRPGSRENARGLVLDDYLHAAGEMRRTFKLPKPSFSLREVESHAAAPAAIEAILRETSDRHGAEIYSKPHELLSHLGKQIYGDWTQTGLFRSSNSARVYQAGSAKGHRVRTSDPCAITGA